MRQANLWIIKSFIQDSCILKSGSVESNLMIYLQFVPSLVKVQITDILAIGIFRKIDEIIIEIIEIYWYGRASYCGSYENVLPLPQFCRKNSVKSTFY